jgi:hypothetical protein
VDRPDPDDPEGGGADETLVQQLAGEDQVQVLKAGGDAHIHDVPDAAITEDLSAVYLRSAGR